MAAHSAVSATAATVLAEFFENDAIAFTSSAEVSAGGAVITRSFDSFSEAAQEAGASRIYGGIHWSFDNQAGLQAGHSVGGFVATNLLPRRGNTDRDGDRPVADAARQRLPDGAVPGRKSTNPLLSDSSDDNVLA
jgi:hypothetical protein